MGIGNIARMQAQKISIKKYIFHICSSKGRTTDSALRLASEKRYIYIDITPRDRAGWRQLGFLVPRKLVLLAQPIMKPSSVDFRV